MDHIYLCFAPQGWLHHNVRASKFGSPKQRLGVPENACQSRTFVRNELLDSSVDVTVTFLYSSSPVDWRATPTRYDSGSGVPGEDKQVQKDCTQPNTVSRFQGLTSCAWFWKCLVSPTGRLFREGKCYAATQCCMVKGMLFNATYICRALLRKPHWALFRSADLLFECTFS